MNKIKVMINGKEVEFQEGLNIQEMLEIRQVTGSMFVVEKNMEIIPKDKYNLIIKNNDVLEIVGFFGGG